MMARNRQTSMFIAGVILMGLGGLFLIAQLLGGTFWAYFWPYLIIGVGLTFLVSMITGGRGAGGLAIPGSVVTTVGTILFIQNAFGWWESWTFAWTFIVISVGVGIYMMGVINESEKAKSTGVNIAGIGAVLLFVFGAFFGMGSSFLGFSFAGRIIWPLMMIAVGAFLVVRWNMALKDRSSNGNGQSVTSEAQTDKKPENESSAQPSHV
jgi:hypothetical protein